MSWQDDWVSGVYMYRNGDEYADAIQCEKCGAYFTRSDEIKNIDGHWICVKCLEKQEKNDDKKHFYRS